MEAPVSRSYRKHTDPSLFSVAREKRNKMLEMVEIAGMSIDNTHVVPVNTFRHRETHANVQRLMDGQKL